MTSYEILTIFYRVLGLLVSSWSVLIALLAFLDKRDSERK